MFRDSKPVRHDYTLELPLRKFHIRSHKTLTENDFIDLHAILDSFPHSPASSMGKSYDHDWVDKFLKIPFHLYPVHILKIAANAIDQSGRSMLSISCEWGACLDITKKLLDLGADVNAVESGKRKDANERKVALHWAIANKLSFQDKDSDACAAVVSLLLERGADYGVTCYQAMTLHEYAKQRGYTAAVRMIEAAKDLDYAKLRFL